MALPAMIAAGYTVQGTVIENPVFEWVLLGSTLVAGYFTVIKNRTKHANSGKALLLWAIGFLLILTEQINWSPIPYLPVVGGLMLAVAFWLNHKSSHINCETH